MFHHFKKKGLVVLASAIGKIKNGTLRLDKKRKENNKKKSGSSGRMAVFEFPAGSAGPPAASRRRANCYRVSVASFQQSVRERRLSPVLPLFQHHHLFFFAIDVAAIHSHLPATFFCFVFAAHRRHFVKHHFPSQRRRSDVPGFTGFSPVANNSGVAAFDFSFHSVAMTSSDAILTVVLFVGDGVADFDGVAIR